MNCSGVRLPTPGNAENADAQRQRSATKRRHHERFHQIIALGRIKNRMRLPAKQAENVVANMELRTSTFEYSERNRCISLLIIASRFRIYRRNSRCHLTANHRGAQIESVHVESHVRIDTEEFGFDENLCTEICMSYPKYTFDLGIHHQSCSPFSCNSGSWTDTSLKSFSFGSPTKRCTYCHDFAVIIFYL